MRSTTISPSIQFLREQLAGDLLPDDAREYERVIATGFLAIGTKILAEKDPGKKQADMVDEQIDTVGKALLGFTVACARCHDHKFDPIPTTDYYALAGILHSTKLEDRVIETQEYLDAKAAFDRSSAALAEERRGLEAKLSKTRDGLIDREAEDFQRGNVAALDTGSGESIGISAEAILPWAMKCCEVFQRLPRLRIKARAPPTRRSESKKRKAGVCSWHDG